MSEGAICPIWGTPAREFHEQGWGRAFESARTGGRFRISGTAEVTVQQASEQDKVRLTNWLVQQRKLGNPEPEIHSAIVEQSKSHPLATVGERAQFVLTYLEIVTEFIGETIKIESGSKEHHDLLAWSGSTKGKEVSFLLKYLENEKFLILDVYSSGFNVTITMDGYSELDALRSRGAITSQVFVAMWFHDSLDDAFSSGFELGIGDAGYRALRIDKKQHNNKIDDELIAEIRRSRFLVADFTQSEQSGARGGVYYEAGFAFGLGIPVIYTCREDCVQHLHFDTRQFNHITWNSPKDLRKKLADRISATVGDGPLREVD